MAEVVGSIPIAPTKVVAGGSFAIRRQQSVKKELGLWFSDLFLELS